jgi:hypothetical protein
MYGCSDSTFKKVHAGKATTFRGSYDILKGQPVKFMTHWSVSSSGECNWTNGESIYQFNFKTSKSRLVFSKWHFIQEFCVRDSFAFIVYNPSKQEGIDDNRFSPGLNFCCLNLKSGRRKYYDVPNKYNFTNLSISPDRRWAAFINTLFSKNGKFTKDQLVLFDLNTQTLKVIDSAENRHQWFGNEDKHNSSLWQNSATLVYYKNTKEEGRGSILSYNTLSGEISVKLKEIPESNFIWFGYDGKAFYFSDRHSIYKTIDGKDREVVIGNQGDVLQATLYHF